MARINSGEFNQAQQNNIEKISGDYFIKVLPSDSNGNFISHLYPLSTGKPDLRQEVDTTDGSVIYMGWADMEATTDQAVWKIKRVTISGSSITTEWADGDTDYNNIFDNRASLSYS